jgi:carotenoid cleavage dioxygenase
MNKHSIERRRLLAGAAVGTAGRLGRFQPANSLSRFLLSGSTAASAFGAAAPAWADSARAVREASPLDAWADAFADVPESYGPVRVAFDKVLPVGLEGTLYRNGPARMQRGNTAYQHWFDGDGMMHAFSLGGSSLQHRARMIRTDKYVLEEKAGRFLHPGFGTGMPDGLPISKSDDLNVANISVLPVGDELLALWEAGSPWRIDPQTLETLGRKVWSAETDGLAFSAHPKVDRDGTVWSFGYLAGSGKLVLYRLDPRGALRETRLIDAPNADMVHDFAITERWLVFVLMPLVFDRQSPRGNGSFIAKYQWRPERAGVVLLIDKNTLEIAHRFETPATAFFHIGNAWEDGDTVRVQLMKVDDFQGLMGDVYDAMQRRPVDDPVHTGPVEIVADLRRGQTSLRTLSQETAEFPRVDPRHVGRRTRSMFIATRTPSMPAQLFGLNAVARIDTESGRLQRFDYGAELLAEEHVFVPRAGAPEGNGWLVGTAWNRVTRRTVLSVFDAGAIDAGPIAQAGLPYGLPLGLHGTFVGA